MTDIRTPLSFLLLLLAAAFAVALTPPQKEIRWTAIGDSITYLNDHPNETGNRITKGYMTRVCEQLPQIRFTNQGHNGWTVVRIATDIEKLGLQEADVYSVFLGTNDWWHAQPLGTMQDYIKATGTGTVYGAYRVIVDKLHRLNAKAPIIFITPMQRGDFVYISNLHNNAWGSYRQKEGQSLEQFAQAVKEIAQYEHSRVIDLYHTRSLAVSRLVRFKRVKDTLTGTYRNYPYPQYTSVPFNPDTDDYPYPPDAIGMTYDGLHPSDRGFEVIAGLLTRIMKKL